MNTAKPLLASMLFLSLCAGCGGGGPVSWRTVLETEAPRKFVLRGDEVWSHGEKKVMRRAADGTWSKVELCSGEKEIITVAFEGEAVWSLCGGTEQEGQVLLRHDGAGTAQEHVLPVDGTFILIPLVEGPPALLGESNLHTFDGQAFVSRGPHLHADAERLLIMSAAGVSKDEIYVDVSVNNANGAMWWNGTRWNKLLGDLEYTLELRFGQVWTGTSKLEDGFLVNTEFKSLAEMTKRSLQPISMASPEKALLVGGRGTQFYLVGPDDAEPTLIANAPVEAGEQAGDTVVTDVYGNEYQVMGRGDNGSGVTFVYGANENLLLIGYTEGTGMFAGPGKEQLIEGTR